MNKVIVTNPNVLKLKLINDRKIKMIEKQENTHTKQREREGEKEKREEETLLEHEATWHSVKVLNLRT